jgi:anti-sigma-K factor RskA
MIPEEQQDQAALYALGLLSVDEVAAFETQLRSNEELRVLVSELKAAAADVSMLAPPHTPPPQIRDRVLQEVALIRQAEASRITSRGAWLPWAIAAALALFCGWLALDHARLSRELAEVRTRDPLAQTTVYVLAPTAQSDQPGARATVTWLKSKQTGLIKVTNLPNPGPARDYQLWAVDANHKDPVSAGLIKVDANGTAEVRFRPAEETSQVKAFAISLEREGGVAKAEGPILLAGTG